MEIKKTEHFIEVQGVDNNGEFLIRILKDCSQLQMGTEDNDAYIDVNYRELKTIRDAITEVLDGFGQADANTVLPAVRLSMEEILKDAVRRKATYQVQFSDYDLDTWNAPCQLTENRIEKLLDDGSIRKVRLELEM